MMLFIVSTFNIIVIWLDTKGILLKLIAGQKTVPMRVYLLFHQILSKLGKWGVI